MVADNHSQAMESFPVLQMVISFIIWVLPPTIAAVFIFLPISTSSIATIVILLLIVTSVPISAYVLYRIDLSRNDGYVSVWGFR